MSTEDFDTETGQSARSAQRDRSTKSAKEAVAAASSLAGEAVDQVKQAASSTAATVTGEMKELLNRQVGGGANMLGSVARSAKRAAEDLEGDSPQMAGLVRTFASRVDGYADGLKSQSIDQLWDSTRDFTRRQPALVFGLAALAGFFLLRTIKSTPSVSAPSIQPSHTPDSGGGDASYGS